MQIRREESNMMTLDEITKKYWNRSMQVDLNSQVHLIYDTMELPSATVTASISKLRKSRISRASTFISMVRQMEKKYIFRSL